MIMETNILEKTSLNNRIENVLSFEMGNELFAISVSKVIEILEVSKITRVPRAPAYLTGVVNVRGKVLPLIDTRIKLGLSPVNFTVNTCIVIVDIKLENQNIHLGVLVDSVLEVLAIRQEEIQASPNLESKYKNDFVRGIFRQADNFVMILNLDHIFSRQEVETLQKAGQRKSSITSVLVDKESVVNEISDKNNNELTKDKIKGTQQKKKRVPKQKKDSKSASKKNK